MKGKVYTVNTSHGRPGGTLTQLIEVRVYFVISEGRMLVTSRRRNLIKGRGTTCTGQPIHHKTSNRI